MVKIGMLIADRYEVLEKIGTGGMSVVYRAKDHKLNRFVAIKALKQEFSDNANFVSKFRVEAQAAAGLMHPNIVNVYDVGDEKGMYYIVMELVDGITLKQYIEKKSRLSVKEAISIAIQVSMGLEAAHNNHIIHRDIKPQNIIISKDGKVKVTDFGIAKAATSNTITSNVMGSVHYTSPEQARGGYSDERSDIYSLGISIFEMLTGRVPFNGETTVAIAIKHIQSPMPSPRDFVPDIPNSVEQIVLKCCEKSPDRRYQNMQELIADLKQSLIHPNDNFVRVIHPDEQSATRISTGKEREDIRRHLYRDDAIREEEYPEEDDYEDYHEDYHYEDDYGEDEPYEPVKPAPSRQPERVRRTRTVRKRYDEDDFTDDFEENDYSPGKDRLITVLAVIAAILIGLGIIAYAAMKLGLVPSGNEEPEESVPQDQAVMVTVPAVIGNNGEEMRQALQDLGLTAEITYVESDDYEAGQVVGSNVQEGTQVASGSSIVLTVSAGRNGIEVPDVTGKSLAEAVSTIRNKGFTVNKEEEASDEVEMDHIISQVPAAGEFAPSGSTVTIRISTGQDKDGRVQVPKVTGMTIEEAMARLTEAGLTYESAEVEATDPNMAGLVSSQSEEAGSYVEPDTKILLKVAKSNETEEPQTPVTYSYSAEVTAPTAAEAPDYVPGTQVYAVIIASDGTKLLETTTTTFPIPTGYTHIISPTGTLSMSYPSTAPDAQNGQKVITRQLNFVPEQ